jgi:uncharacterized protein (DUF362 family)
MTDKYPPGLTRRTFLKTVASVMASYPLLKPVIPQSTSRRYQVAIGQAAGYDSSGVLRALTDLLDSLGGSIISPGDSVAIKVNLTSGTRFSLPPDMQAVESYMTHPEVAHALGCLLRDAGAREIYFVEALYDDISYSVFGFEEAAKAINATLIDLNNPDPYDNFIRVDVGNEWYMYDYFMVHPVLQEVDAFVSIAKMKCHFNCGVTLSMKNLVGAVPVSHYRAQSDHNWRSALHGITYGPHRIPRVVVDLNRAIPIDLAIIDGIKAAEGGEVPWGSFAPVEPGVLVAGKNALATDAVATAVMGFDPTADFPQAPFLHGDNHLNLAYEKRLGSNRLNEIDVVGVPIESVLYPFLPALSQQ